MGYQNLINIKKRSVNDLITPLLCAGQTDSGEAGMRLVREASSFGLTLPDFLKLAVDVKNDENAAKAHLSGMNGYEIVKMALNLPTKNDFANQIMLAQSTEIFAQYPGARALFPHVIDDVLRWKGRIDNNMNVADLCFNSRTIAGPEMTRIVIEENEKDSTSTFRVAEGANIPLRTVKTGENSVAMYKHGTGFSFTYEFANTVSLDLLTPFAARVERRLMLSKMQQATELMINGYSNAYAGYGPATTVKQVTLNAAKNDGNLDFETLLKHIINEAKRGVTVTSIAGNYDAYFQFAKMFSPDKAGFNEPDALAAKGMAPAFTSGLKLFEGVKFVLDTFVPAGKLLCFNKNETLEELIQANGRIEEEESCIRNQTKMYVRTEIAGYSLVFGDTRSIYDYGSTS